MESLIFIHKQRLSGLPLFLRGATWLPGKHNTKTDEKKAGGRRDGGSDEGMKVGGVLFFLF